MAIIGNPPIILLDEPSAGMDPEARRFMWSVVEQISQRDKKSAVILTTHSMEEAEALSTKMGIMVRGGLLRCLGSAQHIKNKFATGYEIEIKICNPSFSELDQFKDSIGIEASLVEKVELISVIRQLKENDSIQRIILDQVTKDGIGSGIWTEADSFNGQVRMQALTLYLFV